MEKNNNNDDKTRPKMRGNKSEFLGGIISRADKAKILIGTLSAAILLVVSTVAGVTDYMDKYEDRQERQRERERAEAEYMREQNNKQQAFYLSGFVREEMQAMMDEYNANLQKLMKSAVEKDSVLLIVIPKLVENVSLANSEIARVNHKVSVLINEQSPQEKVDFIRILHERDSIALANQRYEEDVKEILRQVKLANERLLENQQPQRGDRVK